MLSSWCNLKQSKKIPVSWNYAVMTTVPNHYYCSGAVGNYYSHEESLQAITIAVRTKCMERAAAKLTLNSQVDTMWQLNICDLHSAEITIMWPTNNKPQWKNSKRKEEFSRGKKLSRCDFELKLDINVVLFCLPSMNFLVSNDNSQTNKAWWSRGSRARLTSRRCRFKSQFVHYYQGVQLQVPQQTKPFITWCWQSGTSFGWG